MTLEEMRHAVSQLAMVTADPWAVDLLIQSGMEIADEMVSLRGGPVGLDWSSLDLTANRDIYPLHEAFVRLKHVEGMTDPQGVPQPYHYVQSQILQELQNRGGRGSFWSQAGDNLLISPPPSQDYQKGLRVWGYPRHTFEVGGSVEQELSFAPYSRDYVLWVAVMGVATDRMAIQRAQVNLQMAHGKLLRLVQKPTVGNPIQRVQEQLE